MMCGVFKTKTTAVAIAAAVIIGFLASPIHAVENSGKSHVVEIRNLKFHPEKLVVRQGDVVIWINKDIVPHTVTADNESWDSQSIVNGKKWETIVQLGMRQAYFCQFHPTMKGQLKIAAD